LIKAVKNPVSIIEQATNKLNDFCPNKNLKFKIAGRIKNSDDNNQTAM
jgi:hypothetical protein